MCVTLHEARLGQTTIAGWRNPGRRTHALLYGNQPENLAGVPNAMILHIPLDRDATLTRDNFIPTHGLRHVLADMWAAAPKWQTRETRGGLLGVAGEPQGVSVFDMGSYTWIAATRADPEDIYAALQEVRDDRRPQIGPPLIDWYRRTWPHDALAIGCFDAAGGGATEPVCVEYPPQKWGQLRYPATDAHGHVPRWGERVMVDHRIVVGTDELDLGGRVGYREAPQMDPRLRELVPERVVGAELARVPMIQGDFYIDFSSFAQGHQDRTGQLIRARGPAPAPAGHDDLIPVPLG